MEGIGRWFWWRVLVEGFGGGFPSGFRSRVSVEGFRQGFRQGSVEVSVRVSDRHLGSWRRVGSGPGPLGLVVCAKLLSASGRDSFVPGRAGSENQAAKQGIKKI